jgi:hypothetical protein
LSEFLQRLQDRLKAKRNAQDPASESSSTHPQSSKIHSALTHIKQVFGGNRSNKYSAGHGLASTLSLAFKPTALSNVLSYVLMLLTGLCLTYWLMRIAQIPAPPSQPATGINKGVTLYTNQDGANAYGLFGSKPLLTDNIFLRGVVVTSKNKAGALDGFAIFEIDGKPTNAISVGESLGKGLSLQSIGDESATLLYQGQKMDFKLSKPGQEKSANPTSKK